MAWMYILKCADGSFYVRPTIKLESRLFQHQQGTGAIYTSQRLPVELVYCEEYQNVAEAFAREKQVQNWSHAKREALVQRSFQKLSGLSNKKFKNNELPRGKPRGITDRNTQEHAQKAAGYSSSRNSGINNPRTIEDQDASVSIRTSLRSVLLDHLLKQYEL